MAKYYVIAQVWVAVEFETETPEQAMLQYWDKQRSFDHKWIFENMIPFQAEAPASVEDEKGNRLIEIPQ